MGAGTTFHRVLWDDAESRPGEKIKLRPTTKIRRVVLCSGKVYYDLYEAREAAGIDDVYLLRVEQLYPFPAKALMHELGALPERRGRLVPGGAARTWAPGASSSRNIEWVLQHIGAKHKRPRYAGRPASASTATGLLSASTSRSRRRWSRRRSAAELTRG